MSLISLSIWSIMGWNVQSAMWWCAVGHVVGGPCDFSVSPWSKSFFFPFLGDFYSTWGPVGTGARTWTWTRAWQLFKLLVIFLVIKNFRACFRQQLFALDLFLLFLHTCNVIYNSIKQTKKCLICLRHFFGQAILLLNFKTKFVTLGCPKM